MSAMTKQTSRRAVPRGSVQPYRAGLSPKRTEIARSGTAMSESRTDAYGYNTRNELISATKLGGPASVLATLEYAYQYDDIGNRITSTDLTTNRTYTANSLNQYTLISNLCASIQKNKERSGNDEACIRRLYVQRHSACGVRACRGRVRVCRSGVRRQAGGGGARRAFGAFVV